MHGLFRYETAQGRWWACAQDEQGGRVHIIRERYEQMALDPDSWRLPVEDDGKADKKRA